MNSRILVILLILVAIGGGIYYFTNTRSTKNAPPKDVKVDNSLNKVLASKELRVGSALEELPWGDIDKNTGEEIGAEVEIAKLVAKKLGVKLILVNKGFDYLLDELINKQYDVVIAGYSITPERAKRANFTDPYLITGLALIVKSSNTDISGVDDLDGKKVGTLAGTTSHDFLEKLKTERFKNLDVRIYDDPGKYIQDTLNGKIDATVYDATAANRYLKENPDLKLAGPLLQTEKYGMALRKEDKALLAKLNEIIAEMRKSEEFKAITTKWYGPTE